MSFFFFSFFFKKHEKNIPVANVIPIRSGGRKKLLFKDGLYPLLGQLEGDNHTFKEELGVVRRYSKLYRLKVGL